METQTLDIPVLWPDYFEDCEQCTERLRETLSGLDGVQSVTIDVEHRTIDLAYDKDLITFEEISERARQLGVTVAQRYHHESIQVVGLDCPDCAMKLETVIRRMKGLAWASLNYATSVLLVEFEPERVTLADVQKRVRDFGYEIAEEKPLTEAPVKVRTPRAFRMLLTVLSGALLAAGGLVWALGGSSTLYSAIFIASAVCGGIFAARSGFLSLRGLTLDTNFLMSAAAIGAIALGDFAEAAAVMFLFSLGSTLEAYTVDRTRRSIRSLIEAFPTTASVRRGGHIVEVRLEDVEIGEVVLIKPGEKVPVDGTIIQGESTLNEAPITGESIPVDKTRGDTVYAGTINGRGALEVRTTSSSDDNTLSRIIHMVEAAQAQKAPSQRFSETFGRYYTPCVIALAAAVGAAGPFVFGGGYHTWIERALTLLVVSCPCALVISTPVAIVAAIGNAARSGVLIKGGAHLETLGDVSIAAFDKTGTLTKGQLAVCGVVPFNSHTTEELLAVAAAIESRSEHPLADAIIAKAREIGVKEMHVAFFESFPGKGARAVVDSEAFYIGSRRMLEERGIDVIDSPETEELLASGCSVVYISDTTAIWGAIGARDVLKETSAQAISHLKAAGIQRTVMLTGDTVQTGRAIAHELGIDEAYAELLPEDKLAKIREMSAGRHRVVMVGDGINDAPALAAANVGVAMGGAGSAAAVEAADVALMADDIAMLPYAVALSRKARKIIIQNVIFALAVVVILIGGALVKWVTLPTGVIGHEGSALLVIANSMRLLKRG